MEFLYVILLALICAFCYFISITLLKIKKFYDSPLYNEIRYYTDNNLIKNKSHYAKFFFDELIASGKINYINKLKHFIHLDNGAVLVLRDELIVGIIDYKNELAYFSVQQLMDVNKLERIYKHDVTGL